MSELQIWNEKQQCFKKYLGYSLWPESSGLGNIANGIVSKKIFLLELHYSVRNVKNLEATLPRLDDSGLCGLKIEILL